MGTANDRKAYQVDIEPFYEDEVLGDESTTVDSNEHGQQDVQPSSLESKPREPESLDLPSASVDLEGSRDRFDADAAWQATLSELALQLQASVFDTWIRDAQLIAYEDGEFIVGLPHAYACDWVENQLRTPVKRTLRSIVGREIQITFRVYTPRVGSDDDFAQMPLYDMSYLEEDVQDEGIQNGDVRSTTTNVEAIDAETKWAEPIESTDSATNSATEENGADIVPERKPAPRRASVVIPPEEDYSDQLIAHHTFDSFVVGNHNRLAHAAAEAVANQPGRQFNPLFLYGGVGLGKTHLLHAIGNRAHQNGYRTLYCSSEQFTNDLISAIRSQSTEAFRNVYRQVDILLIDDIQFIGGKESTQEEFFHTFNHLQSSGAQVILSSDRPPKALATLEERLRSRFEGGLQTDIAQPDFETRVAILQTKAKKLGMPVPQDVLMLVAERVDSNIRELEGALNQLFMQARLSNTALNLSLAMVVLDNLAPSRTPCTPGTLIRVVAEHYGLAEADLVGRRRTKVIANARQVVMYLLREENCLSLPAIGEHLGGRDHTTVRYGVEQISQRLTQDDALHQAVAQLRERIYTPYIG